ncbi:hypothetical protein BWI17_13410 [Betaproteobacteria bacterium GR16-43]|nr:hypothetical protein BWI17_13410 [Betaproteobacteria bacterium GR16-43]
MADEPFLSRWSRRKVEARVAPPQEPPAEAIAPAPVAERSGVAEPPAPLPPIESLTAESDFTGFMKPDVEAGLRNKALRTLFQNPQFNVMDGLDIYIADYSQPDPMPESWLSQLNQVARLGAWEDPDEKASKEAAAATLDAPQAAEKPAVEQGLADSSSAAASDTAGGGISPPPVAQSDPSAPR